MRARDPSVRLLALAALTGGACGDEAQPPELLLPTADEVRAFAGLGPGSCIRYQRDQTRLEAVVEVSGPNDRVLPGRTVYRWSFRKTTAGSLPDLEWLLEPQDDGELRLARIETFVNGDRQVKTYPPDSEPLLLRLEYGSEGTPSLGLNARFEVQTTPEVTLGTPEPERHLVIVQDQRDVFVPGPEGSAPGFQLRYEQDIGTAEANTVYRLAVGRGFTYIQEQPGETFSACDWRICDLSGTCTGASSCNALDCP